jgi:hypothetical protein
LIYIVRVVDRWDLRIREHAEVLVYEVEHSRDAEIRQFVGS